MIPVDVSLLKTTDRTLCRYWVQRQTEQRKTTGYSCHSLNSLKDTDMQNMDKMDKPIGNNSGLVSVPAAMTHMFDPWSPVQGRCGQKGCSFSRVSEQKHIKSLVISSIPVQVPMLQNNGRSLYKRSGYQWSRESQTGTGWTNNWTQWKHLF